MSDHAKSGLLFGLGATLVMTLVMAAGMLTGVSPIPQPIPVALAALVLGAAPKPVLMLTGLVAHFAYGAFWGGVYGALAKDRAGIGGGLLLGGALWLIMQLVVLPVLGWGVFGSAITPKIAVATLVLHLIYGGLVGWALHRKVAPSAGADRGSFSQPAGPE